MPVGIKIGPVDMRVQLVAESATACDSTCPNACPTLVCPWPALFAP